MRLQLPKWYEEDLWHPLGFGPGINRDAIMARAAAGK